MIRGNHNRVAQLYGPLDAMVTSLAIAIIEAYELRISDFFKKGVRSSTDSKSVKTQFGPTSFLTFRPYKDGITSFLKSWLPDETRLIVGLLVSNSGKDTTLRIWVIRSNDEATYVDVRLNSMLSW